MAKDIGMTIRKGIVVPFLPLFGCFLGIPSLYVLSFFLMFFCYLIYYNGIVGQALVGVCGVAYVQYNVLISTPKAVKGGMEGAKIAVKRLMNN